MKKTPEHLVLASMVLLWIVYAAALYCLPMIAPESAVGYETRWLRYTCFFLQDMAAACLLIQAFLKAVYAKDRDSAFFWFVGALLVYLFGKRLTWTAYLRYYLQQILLILWPFISMYLIAWIRSRKKWICVGKGDFSIFVYYIFVTVCIGFILNVLRFTRSGSFDLFQMFYLLSCSVYAWHSKEKTGMNVISVILPAASLGILSKGHSRILEIIQSFTNPMSSVYAQRGQENWLGDRLQMMRDVWLGNTHTYEEMTSYAAYGVPLAVIKNVMGYIGVVFVIALEIFMLYQLYQIYKKRKLEENCRFWEGMLLFAVVLDALLGIVVDILLVKSSGMGFLLLTNRMPLFLILFFLYATNDKYMIKSKYKISIHIEKKKDNKKA